MTAPTDESPAATLRRAADLVERLEKAASPTDWCGYSDCPTDQPRGEIFCGPRDEWGYRTGSVCSWSEDDENGKVMSQTDVDLVSVLREAAAPLVAWLRSAAEAAPEIGDDPRALAVARAILGEAKEVPRELGG